MIADKKLFVKKIKSWSGIPESNWRLDLGKITYCHYTNPAMLNILSELGILTSLARPVVLRYHGNVDTNIKLTSYIIKTLKYVYQNL